MLRTEFGTGAKEFTQVIEEGLPCVVRYRWAGGDDRREREVVTAAIAACFGVKSLVAEQTITEADENLGPLADRIRYAFWLLRVFGLSLGFTHGRAQVDGAVRPASAGDGAAGSVRRISLQVDRSRYREEYNEG